MRIILVGYMGSGKSKFSKAVAARFGMDVVDTDHLIESSEAMTISDIFATKGEAYFREAERRVIDLLAGMENTIVATGGGLPCFGDNMERLKRIGLTIYLKVSVPELVYRLEVSHQKRPLIEGKNHDQLVSFVTENLQAREKFYNLADIKYDANGRDAGGLIGIIEFIRNH